ncbi:hypothetical protein J120_05040 [candidate division TM6 bacterium JCVI TM6SC1]|jgi:hypothetical protein|uniref:Uncharacterized protein n=1 Tax=candidate division TM6 bacterium JCVI TM6SC1 TaxID=1306947 RepID=A0A0D2JKK8_9BACT|nr:hypothetical protein J120_05040 [candidate division TM6 bacterium JCVI TM6SC1]
MKHDILGSTENYQNTVQHTQWINSTIMCWGLLTIGIISTTLYQSIILFHAYRSANVHTLRLERAHATIKNHENIHNHMRNQSYRAPSLYDLYSIARVHHISINSYRATRQDIALSIEAPLDNITAFINGWNSTFSSRLELEHIHAQHATFQAQLTSHKTI